jgi:acid phosphatase family membrane protein YuiD
MNGLSLYIGTIAIAWFVAQGLKYIISSIKNRSFTESLNQLYLSGNMPSAHSATVVALTIVIGATEGLNSAVFGLAVLFSAIVMYDAMMVRRSSGEQGKALIQLIEASKSKITRPRVAKGHTPMEVLAGAIVGSLVGLIVVLVTS